MADDSRSTPDAKQDQIILGRALRELRDRAGITQGELAARMGIDLTYISRIERGKRGVRWHTVLRFLAALDSDLHDLADAVDIATSRAAAYDPYASAQCNPKKRVQTRCMAQQSLCDRCVRKRT